MMAAPSRTIVEHAPLKDKTPDETMGEWNEKRSAAQENPGIEVKF